MLQQIGSRKSIPDFIKRVKAGEVRLMGFGHRVYKNYDPRARIIKRTADEVFEVTGQQPTDRYRHRAGTDRAGRRLLRQAEALSKRRFLLRHDLSGHGFPRRRCSLCCSPSGRTPGWLTQWEEMLLDKDQKIGRPRQIYLGPGTRDFVPIEERSLQPVAKGG